jgi:hypothetical protein
VLLLLLLLLKEGGLAAAGVMGILQELEKEMQLGEPAEKGALTPHQALLLLLLLLLLGQALQ